MEAEKLWKKYGYPEPKSEASKGPFSLVDNEIYSGICLPELPFVARLDGWRFRPLTKKLKLKFPYDKFFAKCLVKTAKQFFTIFNPKLAYIFSDEINLLFLKIPFQRIEKIDSTFAGLASSVFHEAIRKRHEVKAVAFDCRCIPLREEEILKYFRWRQAEAFRNHNNSWAYWILRKEGESARAATEGLRGLDTAELFKLCKEHGIDLNKTPTWQRHGILLYKEPYRKEGFDPIRKKKVFVKRYRIKEDWELPRFDSSKAERLFKKVLI
ncbi:MAG: tRNA(His) guanylyltransferase Thg1 family protein [Candidatus Aenigmarchaeota archaeon]|nr:tRNA(His) guanylyltransferase Thg1 family protein [Candidatus Aenigmarchaeota archaeon]